MVFSLWFGFLNIIRNFYPILIFCFNVLYFFHTPLSPHDDSIFWNTSLFGKTSTLEVSSLENFYLSGIGGRRVYWDCIELKDDTRNAVNSAQQLLADFSLVNSCLNLIAVMSGLPSSQTCSGIVTRAKQQSFGNVQSQMDHRNTYAIQGYCKTAKWLRYVS